MTGPSLSSIPEQGDGLLTHTLSTGLHIASASASAVLGLLPASVGHMLSSLLTSAQLLLIEHWEARVVAVCLMLPSVAVLAVLLSTAVAILWPFSFPVGTVGSLAITAIYLFWPSTTDLKACLISAAFALSAQVVLALPVYFLSPAALFVLLLATSAYLLVSSSWLLLAGTSWWLITTPYWSLVHFVAFPFLFTASILAQVACSVAALLAIAVVPDLPSLLSRHYDAFVEQRTVQAASQPQGGGAARTQHGSDEWLKTEYGASKRRDERVKEESKTHE